MNGIIETRELVMQTCRFIASVFAKTILLTYGLSAFAQPKQWVDDLLLVESHTPSSLFFIDENNTIKRKIPFITDLPDFETRRSLHETSGWRNDGLYAAVRGVFEKNADGFHFVRWAFTKWQDGEWDILGFFKLMDDPGNQFLAANPLKIIPCDNDRFIVISRFTDLSGNSEPKATPFTRVKLSPATKEIKIEASIDHGMDELVERISNVDDFGEYLSNMNFFGLVYDCNVFITGNHATLIDKKGLYWIFSLEKATLVKSGNIFKSMTPEKFIKAREVFAGLILASNPENDGSILISAREEAMIDVEIDLQKELDFSKFLESLPSHLYHFSGEAYNNDKDYRDLFNKYSNEFGAFAARRRKETNDMHPWVEWYRIYPESGKIEKILNPEGAAIELDGREYHTWRPMPDGSVKMGPVELVELQKPKPAQDKEKDATTAAK
jgi:hypothetical protein